MTIERLQDDERQLGRRLEAYAELRLRPDPVATARMRSALVAEARRRAVPTPVRPRIVTPWRLGASLLAAAAMIALVAGSVAASQAGGPLYGARIWVEAATLPSEAAPRAVAEIGRLDARLAELRGALESKDTGATTATLDAYRSILAETLAGPTPDANTMERLEAAISKHLDVLRGLLATAPPQALDGLRNAIDRSDNGLRELERRANGGGPGNRPSTPPGQASTPPGQASTPPGQASTPPGQASTPPGQASTPPGHASTPPGQASTPPGHAGPSSDPSSKPDASKEGSAKP